MINTDNNEKTTDPSTKVAGTDKPDEAPGIYIRGFLKITDPESGEVLVQTGN
jgi:hypothetical protein